MGVAAAYAVFQTAEQVQAAAISSAGSGNWSNASTWNGGRVPGAGDSVTISGGHTVTYDVTDSQVSGVTIIGNGRLVFASGKSVVLRTDRNIEVLGRLEMKPSSASIQHTIRFVGFPLRIEKVLSYVNELPAERGSTLSVFVNVKLTLLSDAE